MLGEELKFNFLYLSSFFSELEWPHFGSIAAELPLLATSDLCITRNLRRNYSICLP